jgi:hypothetical protein
MEASVLFSQWDWLKAKTKEATDQYEREPTIQNKAKALEMLGRVLSYKREVERLIDSIE